MKSLIIVDPQNDFITGTLPVEAADKAMNRLAKKLQGIEVDHIFVTMDCHPMKHMSFETQDGPWPAHCIKYSEGAAIWEPLFEALLKHSAEVHFIEKGTQLDKEEYSAFEHSYPEELMQSSLVYLCGIAGNVCVLNSLKDLANHGFCEQIVVIQDASPSLDDGSALMGMIQKTGVRVTTLENIK